MSDSSSLIERARQSLDEVEIYLSCERGDMERESFEAVARRLQTLEQIAAGSGADRFSELCHHTAERARRNLLGELDTASEPDCLLLAIRYLRAHLCCIEISESGNELPAGLTEFLDRANRMLLTCLGNAACEMNSGSKGRSTLSDKTLRGLHVLVADDEEIIRVFLNDLIERSGHICMTVADGSDAITALETGLFDIVFTDLNMPQAQGMDVLKHARETSPDTEVVIITGFASLENARDALRFGAYDYLTKPFGGTTEIVSVLHRVQSHQALRRENRKLMFNLRRRNQELARYADSLRDALEVVEEKQRALMHADRMATLGGLSAGVAHEINNPTTFIRGNLQTLQRFWDLIAPLLEETVKAGKESRLQFVLEEMPSLMADMASGTERISRIVSALRSFSHQNLSDTREPTAINDCISDALNLVHNRLKNVVQVEQDLPDNLPQVQADAQQLVQVFVNLIVNAADAVAERPAPRIRVASTQVAEGIQVTVEDNGSGIPESIREKIFDPFFTTKGVGEGTGLGLSILAGIMRDHGGRVDVHSPGPEQGTVFTLTFPLDGTAAQQQNAPTILIVDDTPEATSLMRSAIQASGDYQVEVAEDGATGLEVAERIRPDVIVLDVVMPGMDGFEFIERLLTQSQEAPPVLFAVTGLSAGGVREQLLQMGVREVFFKPFRMRAFLTRLETCLQPTTATG